MGIVLTVLGLAGAWIGRRRHAVRVLTATTLAALFLALGMRLSLFGWHPYATVVHHVDAFARLRLPFRATATAQVLLAVLAAFVLEWLWARRETLPVARWQRSRWLRSGGRPISAAVRSTHSPTRTWCGSTTCASIRVAPC